MTDPAAMKPGPDADQHAFDVIQLTNELPTGKLGGVGTVIDGLASGLRKLGLSVLWFLVDEAAEPGRTTPFSLEGAMVEVGTLADLRRFSAPVLHIHCYEPHQRLLELCRERPSLYTIHSLLNWEARSNDIDLTPSIRWQEALIGAAARVVVISEAERSAYSALGYLDLNPNVSVVPNGVRRAGTFRSPRGTATIGFCGRLVPRKRPEYPQLILKDPHFGACRTLIAGRGFSQYARDLLARERLDSRVDYLGWCAGPRLEAFYEQIDVLAVPSVYEPFGLAALEAVARGIPVVCPGSGGLIEALGDHAYYYKDTSYEGFQSAMIRWIRSSETERDARAKAAFRHYNQNFTEVHMAQSYVRIYAEMAGGPASGGISSIRQRNPKSSNPSFGV
ncbi:MAG TPA: glycosyltransferase family 4 protein [Acetobacteraceae bacterium]|jgi:glycosyltransferase involved in cell wall biosynthesis|nr:glycosyltransferase family 4 protein [Acetobacteraceae bacterium]